MAPADNAVPAFYKRYVVNRSYVILTFVDRRYGGVIDFEFFRVRQSEILVKELSVVAKNIIVSFRFKSPYSMTSHGSDANGFNWEDGHID